MRKGLVVAVAVLFTSAGMAVAQAPQEAPPTVAGNRLWFSSDYLMWWVKRSPVSVPLVTSAPGNSPAVIPGLLGNPDTTVEFGGSGVNTNLRYGGRFALGYWLDNDQRVGLEGNYFFLGSKTVSRSIGSTGDANARIQGYSFYNVAVPAEDFAATGTPRLPAAGIHSLGISSRLNGAEISASLNLRNTENFRLSLLGGVRFARLDEGLQFTGSTLGLTGSGFDGIGLSTVDQFNTRNQFWGGQFGARGEYRCGPWSLTGTAKLALGNMHETVNIDGFTTTSGPGLPTTTVPGGFYALPSNSGRFTRNHFAVIPEANFNVGYQLTKCARLSVGYSFLYLSNVVRPGDQIDRNINPTQSTALGGAPGNLVGPNRPAFNFNDSGYWAQGINFGLEFRY